MGFLVRAFASLIGLLSDDVIRRLARVLFVRTTRELGAACADVSGAQQKRLLGIVLRNKDTEFGKAHDFAAIIDVAGYRQRVPLSTWDAMADDVERMVAGEKNVRVSEDVFFYATTSGTTGRRKLIPVTSAFIEEARVSARILFRTTLLSFPGLLRGRRLAMRSPGIEDVGPGAQAGSITVALSGGLDGEESAFDAVPGEVYRVRDFSTRYALCLRFACEHDLSIVTAVNPSTLLLFAQTLRERGPQIAAGLRDGTLLGEGAALDLDDKRRETLAARAGKNAAAADRIEKSSAEHGGARMADVFPNLVGLVCWKGGSAPWYLTRLKDSYGDLPVLDYGYAASEGLFGSPLSTESAASLLPPHGHFFEFMPEDDVELCRAGEKPLLLLNELEDGCRYFVVVTTSAGLYRYDMNDVIEVVGREGDAPTVVFRSKGGAMSSLTGEKLSEAHIVQAMATACADGPVVAGFASAPLLPDGSDEQPQYLIAVDPAEHDIGDETLAALAERFDRALAAANEEYEAKRRSLRLAPAVATRLPAGAIARYRRRRVDDGAPDAHVKIPHLSADGQLLLDLGLAETDEQSAARLPVRAAGGA